MDSSKNASDYDTCNWEISELRSVLNSEEYLNEHFSPQEKAKILLSDIHTDAGEEIWGRTECETQDYLFIPTKSEMEKYVGEDSSAWGNIGGEYWLRNPDFAEPEMQMVWDNGGTSTQGPVATLGIRLMCWIEK